MIHISASISLTGQSAWTTVQTTETPGLTVSFTATGTRRKALNDLASDIRKSSASRFIQPPTRPSKDPWTLDLDEIRSHFERHDIHFPVFLRGVVQIEPDFEPIKDGGAFIRGNAPRRHSVSFIVLLEDLLERAQAISSAPPELAPALERLRRSQSPERPSAFIMMQFGTTAAHTMIVRSVRQVCRRHGIDAFRADDVEVAPELWTNIKAYMHGCDLGIAIFERLQNDVFNPNVSLELGYMLALGKPVCLLKDQTLKSLHTDIGGFLYRNFDPQGGDPSVELVLGKWLTDNGWPEL